MLLVSLSGFLIGGIDVSGCSPGMKVSLLQINGVIDYEAAKKYKPDWSGALVSNEIADYIGGPYRSLLVLVSLVGVAVSIANLSVRRPVLIPTNT